MKAKDKKTKQADSTKRICESQTRSEACACGACARGTTPAAKYETNKRDVLALLDFIAGCVENHPRHAFETARWGNVGDITHIRGRLMEIAVGYAIGADNSEESARRRLEEALGEDDEHVTEAMIEAV